MKCIIIIIIIKVNKKHPDIIPLFFQVTCCSVVDSGDCISCQPVCFISKLMLVKVLRDAGLKVGEDELLEALHDDRC